MQCIEDAGIDDARLSGPEDEQEIVIGDGADAPHIKFFLTAGEAEAEQFQGHGEGAEQIGVALLYVGNGSDDLLETGREVPRGALGSAQLVDRAGRMAPAGSRGRAAWRSSPSTGCTLPRPPGDSPLRYRDQIFSSVADLAGHPLRRRLPTRRATPSR